MNYRNKSGTPAPLAVARIWAGGKAIYGEYAKRFHMEGKIPAWEELGQAEMSEWVAVFKAGMRAATAATPKRTPGGPLPGQ